MQVKVTISRLHKLVERLKARIKELNADATASLAQSKNWRVSPTADSLQRVQDGVAKGLELVKAATVMAEELAAVKGIISTHNERLGISTRLGRIEALNQQLAHLRAIVSAASGMTSIEEMREGSPVGEYGVTTNVLSDGDLKVLSGEIEKLQRESYRISDEVAEANATRVDVALSDTLAALINS